MKAEYPQDEDSDLGGSMSSGSMDVLELMDLPSLVVSGVHWRMCPLPALCIHVP